MSMDIGWIKKSDVLGRGEGGHERYHARGGFQMPYHKGNIKVWVATLPHKHNPYYVTLSRAFYREQENKSWSEYPQVLGPYEDMGTAKAVAELIL